MKKWTQRAHNGAFQRQIDDYRMADTRLGIAPVPLGARREEGWREQYEEWCLAGRDFEPLERRRIW